MSSGVERESRSLVWAVGFSVVLAVHFLWQLLNDAPPAWDMAFHQLKGWNFLEFWLQGGETKQIWSISAPYPPLYHWIEALVLRIFGDTRLLAFFANLPGLFLLSFGTYRVGRYYLTPTRAGWAGLLVLLFPMVAWVSRESLLDGLLAGWVSVAGLLILRSQFFTRRAWVLLFGLVCAGGLLTKWTFPVYIALPVLYGLWTSSQRGKAFRNLCLAGFLALPFALIYYGPNFLLLASNYPTTEQAGLIPWRPYPRHGEPGLNNYLGWVYYPRALVSYFLFFPLALLFAIGSLWSRTKDKIEDTDRGIYLWVWLVGGLVLLTFVTPKDPRFAIPLVTPLSILLLRFWRKSSWAPAAIIAVAAIQFLLVSFSLPWTPPKLALLSGETDGDFQSIQREWVFFQPEYFGITGPPRSEDWHLAEILKEVPENALVGVMPELPRFNVNGLHLQAARSGQGLNAFALGNLDDWPLRLQDVDLVLVKSGYQGLSFITRYNTAINAVLQSGGWAVLGRWPLPDGSEALLMKPGAEVGMEVGS